MKQLLHRTSLFLLLAILTTGCFNSGVAAAPPVIVAQESTPVPSPTYFLPPPNATATATPFKPLAPTAVYLPTDLPLPTATQLPSPTPTIPLPEAGEQPQVSQPSGQVNILLLGSDQRPWDSHFRTDTIVLATLNPALGTVNLTSFPRDLYINIPRHGTNRINTVWGQGGFDLLAETFDYNFGVRPDHYVLISFSSFKKIIDSLGGLDVQVSEGVSDYRSGMWYTVPAGEVHMDADDVLWYARSRKTSNDFARSRRQQEVLLAIFQKMLSLNAIKRVPEFYNLYQENVRTDLGLTDMLRMLPLAVKLTDSSHIHHYFIGPQQTDDWITYEGAMVLLPRPGAIQEVMRQALNMP